MSKASPKPSPAKRSEPGEGRKSPPGHSKGDKHPVQKAPMKTPGTIGTWRPC